MKRESFVASFADVQVWLLEEQSRVASPPHQEFPTAALSANHSRDSGITPMWQRRTWMPAVSGALFRGWGDIRFTVAPLAIVAGGALLERRLPAYYLRVPAPLVLLSCWAAMPVIMVAAAARWMSPTVLVSKYFLCAAPAIPLIMAWTIRGVRSSRIRLVLVTIVAGLSVLGMGIGVERMEDWRMALHAAANVTNGKPMPVLLGATFIESARLR